MSAIMEVYNYTPELIRNVLSSLDAETDRNLTEQIVSLFYDAGLTIKIKHIFYGTPNAYYRIQCYIKKSAESVIINTRNDLGKSGVVDGLNVQVRIENRDVFERLDSLSESIRKQIVEASDCRYCSAKCEGKRYVFTYANTEYTKCQYLCSNFRFTSNAKEDFNSIVDIIKKEILYKKK